MSEKIFNIVVLGNTGVGKSSLLNMFAGNTNAFLVGDSALSVTQLAVSKVYSFLGKDTMPKLRLIDTQGLSDSGGDSRDMDHIKNMVNCIKELQHIDLFIICFDGTNPRFTSFAQSTVSLFSSIFPDFLYHSILVFNKWSTPNMTRLANLKREYQELFNNYYKIPSIPCYFIDSFFNLCLLRDNDDGTQSERYLHPNIQQRTLAQVHELMNFLNLKGTRCDVTRIVPKDTEMTSLNKQISEAHEKYKEEFRLLEEQRDKSIKQAQDASKIEMENLKKVMEEEQARAMEEMRDESKRKIDNLNNQLEEATNNNNNRSQGVNLLDLAAIVLKPIGIILEEVAKKVVVPTFPIEIQNVARNVFLETESTLKK